MLYYVFPIYRHVNARNCHLVRNSFNLYFLKTENAFFNYTIILDNFDYNYLFKCLHNLLLL